MSIDARGQGARRGAEFFFAKQAKCRTGHDMAGGNFFIFLRAGRNYTTAKTESTEKNEESRFRIEGCAHGHGPCEPMLGAAAGWL